ncbi:T9SS type A sorting domain-containing protein [Polaribacter sp. Hel_I_88]|uniref:T9SS type A sorting domain-containing protein n=1 Tax=Polaribacter sp. Hel_I_88 TaxID=1250006 RepID=UPI00047E3109|nr:T9SS type A sorting domain-containing protein [Polaribacter sp. Hel_I_88]
MLSFNNKRRTRINISFNLVVIVFFTLLSSKISAQWNQPQWVVDAYEPYVHNFVHNGTDEALAYRLLRPINFDESQNYPVVITLHGASGFNKVKANDYNINSLRYINQEFAKDSIRLAHPTYVVCLQAIKFEDGSNDMWKRKHLEGAKQIIAELPNVNLNKIYVMGQSAGGHGTNRFISIDSDYFAAAIATAADGSKIKEEDRDKLINFNMWVMHGDNDGTIPYAGNVELFNYMKSKNGLMKFTTFIRRGHSTEDFMVGNYADEGKVSVVDTDRKTGETTTKTYDYTTQYAGPDSDREANTLDWLFSKSTNQSLSLNDKDIENLYVYPNPTNANIKWNNSMQIDEVLIYNLVGKTLLKIKSPSSNSVDVSNFPKGLYILKISSKNRVFIRKILKKE